MAELVRAFILGGGQEDISFDIVSMEVHRAHLEVTQNPVETGVMVSDHAYMTPLELDIEGEISDTWLHGFDPQTGLAIPDRFYSSKASRSASAFDILLGLQASARPFQVQTGLKLYSNMLIVDLEAQQDPATAAVLPFRMTLREVIIRSTQTVTYPPRAPGKPHRQASKKVDNGQKATAPITDQNQAKTLLKQAFDSITADPTKALSALGF